MPAIPMYRTDVTAPHWRAVFAPGGYEFYEIDLTASQLLLRIGIGNPYSPEYRQLNQRYRRSPTNYPPALPAEFPFALLEHRDKRALLDGRGMELKLTYSSSIQLGPAEIIWDQTTVRCSWANGIADLHLKADLQITTETNPQGEIREFSPFREISGNIAHVFTPTA